MDSAPNPNRAVMTHSSLETNVVPSDEQKYDYHCAAGLLQGN